jgi:hypothetical protein
VEHLLALRYGIPVVTRDIPDPLTGDLDGCQIHVDHAVEPEARLFLLAHLFGHTVQWNVDPSTADLGFPAEAPVAADQLPPLLDYEREAAGYALGLLHEAGITELDQWLSDYSACDLDYLRHYYLTGEKLEFRSFWRDGAALLQARSAPSFRPMRRRFRMDGIVI